MPDLGSYATEVILAYAGALLLLAVIVLLSFAKARRVARQLSDTEGERDGR